MWVSYETERLAMRSLHWSHDSHSIHWSGTKNYIFRRENVSLLCSSNNFFSLHFNDDNADCLNHHGMGSIFANHWSMGTCATHVIPKPFGFRISWFKSHTIFMATTIWFRRTPVGIWQRLSCRQPDEGAFLFDIIGSEIYMWGKWLHSQ